MVAELVLQTDDGMGLDEAIAAYLAACEIEGKSPRTVDAYAETLAMFRNICLQKELPSRVGAFGPAHVYAFLKVIAESGVSPRIGLVRQPRRAISLIDRGGGGSARRCALPKGELHLGLHRSTLDRTCGPAQALCSKVRFYIG